MWFEIEPEGCRSAAWATLDKVEPWSGDVQQMSAGAAQVGEAQVDLAVAVGEQLLAWFQGRLAGQVDAASAQADRCLETVVRIVQGYGDYDAEVAVKAMAEPVEEGSAVHPSSGGQRR